MHGQRRAVIVACCALQLFVVPDTAAQSTDSIRVSLLYTGNSLGALGVLRAQGEHELLTEQANVIGLPFRLVSHMA